MATRKSFFRSPRAQRSEAIRVSRLFLVGPRPERTSYVRELETTIHRYGDRHRVRSGITGWAQVQGLRGKTSIADRAEWDNWYVENFSLWLDLKILVLTAFAIVRYARRGE